jgi:hypothetical protein
MKSAKCAQCGFVGWPDAEFCKKCGAPMSSVPANVTEQPSNNLTTYYSSPAAVHSSELKNGWAIASLVMGIANFLLLGIFLLPTIAGIIVSSVALNKINRYPHEYGGKGLAIGGLVTNIVSIVLIIPFAMIAAIAIPNLLASRMAANEGAAANTLIRIHNAESTYQATKGNGYYGTLNDLKSAGLIAPDLASDTRFGYRFKVEVFKPTRDSAAGFTAVAVPNEYRKNGIRSFFMDETGVLRGEDRQGAEANNSTPPVEFKRGYPSDARRSSSYRDDD